jgi:hypothetical protein
MKIMKTKFANCIAFLTLAGLSIFPAFSRTISSGEAFLIADQHLIRLGKSLEYSLQTPIEIMEDDLSLAYVFDLDPPGYIVVPASTSLPPVMAYSFESNFGALDQANPLFELLTADLLKRMKYTSQAASSNGIKNEELWNILLDKDLKSVVNPLFEQWPALGDGWLKTNWTQSAPYNNFCPMDPVTEQRSYAGCPATAMAQIMNFHNTTNNTHFDDSDDYYHNYAGRQYWIDNDHDNIDFPSFPEMNTYLDTLNAHYLNNIQPTNADKAAMTFACGVAARQVFTSQGSGTFGVNQAFDAYLRFGCNSVELLDSNDADLYDRLKQNIKDTLPAHLAVVDSNWSTGHNVVVDGYNTDDYYHINFGWGGSYNGWYLLPQEIPYELTVIEGVVVDIMGTTTGVNSPEVINSGTFISPNPFRDVSYLNFILSRNSTVTFQLFNISGQEIIKFVVKDQAPGNYSLPVLLGHQPAGIYLYTLQTADGLSSGKIIRVE